MIGVLSLTQRWTTCHQNHNTDKIYGTLSITELKIAEVPDVDLSKVGVTSLETSVWK